MSALLWDWPELLDFRTAQALDGPEPVVGRIDLDRCPDACLARAGAFLDPDECRRRDAFRQRIHGQRFAASRMALRLVLSGYLGVPAGELPIAATGRGKPVLDLPDAPRFNLSHSGPVMLLAIHARFDVGVDVERLTPPFDTDPLRARVLTDTEAACVERCPDPLRGAAFLRYWTVKEAVLKATGEGLNRSMRSLEIDFTGADPVLATRPGAAIPQRRWSLRCWRDGSHACALAWAPPDAAPR